MLTKLNLENVRLFSDQDWEFDLKPLTIFCGTNSAGKSTIIKSLLLLQQSQGINEVNPPTTSKLRFTGAQVDLGSFKSLVSNNDTSKSLSITLESANRIPSVMLEGLKNFAPPASDARKVYPYKLRSRFTFASLKQTDPQVAPQDESQNSNGTLRSAEFVLTLDSGQSLSWQVESIDSKNASAASSYIITIPMVLMEQNGIHLIADIKESHDKKHCIAPVALKGLLPDNIASQLRNNVLGKLQQSKDVRRTVQFPLPSLINGASSDLRSTLADIHYVGPLRAPAKRYYVANLESPPGMDSSGEFLPYVLRENARVWVDYAHPKTWSKARVTLIEALNQWLQYLRTGVAETTPLIANEIRISKTKEVLVEFELRNPSGSNLHALTDSGFGYSQILPILVRGLLAPKGSTLVVEQPELHLNPALQVRLAEFFVGMMKAGKQVVLETHSEHIVNSIRAVAAEEESSDIALNSLIYFIETQSGRPVVHDLSIQSDGTVPRWPRQFFGEALTLSSRLLAAQRRRRAKLPEDR